MTTRRDILTGGAGLAAILASGKAPAYIVKSMLAARNSIGMRVGGAKLPYDAEVEYLESTGTQWIDTGLKGSNGYDFEYSFRPLSPLPCAIGGVYQVQSSCYIGLVRSNGRLAYNYFAPDTIVEVQAMTLGTDYNVSAHLFSGSQYFDVNGVRGGVGDRSGTFKSNGTMYVFAINSPSMLYSYMRLYGLKIYYNNVLVRDFIPVRIGTEGAMYDRVSGQLFRNAGIGVFGYGNDK